MKRIIRTFICFLCLNLSTLSGFAQSGIITTIAGSPLPVNGGVATSQAVKAPASITPDGAGGFYLVSHALNRVYKVSSGGLISTIAGNGIQGYSGDGGPATSAAINGPSGIAIDSAGNLFIVDTGNNRVRKVTPAGVISTVAGSGASGFSGDGGLATSATLSSPADVTVDVAGSLFISDTGNNRVRKVSPIGIMSTVAGNGSSGFSGDGGSAISATLLNPIGVAVDAAGNLFIADAFNNRVRKVDTSGVISTVAGNGVSGFSGDGGSAVSAALETPESIALDVAGSLFIADKGNNRVRKVNPLGVISTAAGNGVQGYSGDGGPATSAQLMQPIDVALDAAGNLFIVDAGAEVVRKVTAGGIVSTVAGTGVQVFSGDSGPATSARLQNPTAIAVDAAGNIVFTDSGDNRVRKISPSGVISTVAGNGMRGYSGDGGLATDALLNSPGLGVALDAAGNIYFSDVGNSSVRKVTPGGVISTIAGNGIAGFDGDGGPATSSQLDVPTGIAFDKTGNLFIADTQNFRIRKVTPDGVISTVAGNGTPGFSGEDGPAIFAALDTPSGIAIDSSGGLIIADTGNQRVRKVDSSGVIRTVAGNGSPDAPRFSGDGGSATLAQLQNPIGIAIDSAGDLFIGDLNNYSVRRVTPGGLISTVAGTGRTGVSGDGIPATSAELFGPLGVAVDTFGNLFIADGQSNRIRKVGSRSRSDFNSDGTTDILWRDSAGNVSMWLLNGYTITDNRFIANIWSDWKIVGTGDFNADGKTDILWRDAAGNMAIWMMDGTTVTSNSIIGTAPTGSTVAGIADFNADGKSDILWRGANGDVAMWLMNGYTVTNSSSSFIVNIWPDWTIVGTGDFNGDGKADILWRDTAGNMAVWQMDGTAAFGFGNIGNMPTSSSIAAVADFNGNGRADILWHDTSGNIAIWMMNGYTITNSTTFIANIWTGWAIVGTGDFNGDGKADILLRDPAGNIAIWMMDGATVSSYGSMGNVLDRKSQ
jgi:trimeric autotransporter adhesin